MKYSIKSNGCWQWVAAKKPNGYGNYYFNGRHCVAHRVSWMLHVGEIPLGMYVCHHCDNPSCVNPTHLFLGLPKENTRDMKSKGRARGMVVGGEEHPNSKLTEKDILEIRQMRNMGLTLSKIGDKFGVCEANVHNICQRKTWQNVQ